MSLQQYSALYENDTGPFDRVSEPDDEDDVVLNSVTKSSSSRLSQAWTNEL